MIERPDDRRFSDLLEVALTRDVKPGEEIPPAPDAIGETGAQRRALEGRFDDDPHAEGRLRALLAEELEARVDLLDRDELHERASSLLWRGDLRWRRRDVPRERAEDAATPFTPPVDPVDPDEPPVDHDYALSLSGPSHIASGAEEVELVYTVSDPDGITTGITVRLLRQRDSAELKRFALSDHAHGPHPFPWDGSVAHGDFANGYANIRHSPYVVEATLHGPKGDRTRRHTVAVELVEFKVRLALASTLSGAADRAVHGQVPYVPVSGKQKLFLTSDLYATQSAEMEDNTAFTAYQTLWGDGPRLPLEVVTRVRASTGTSVPAAKALGDARVLWDHDDAPRSRGAYLSATAKAFIDRARAYDLAAGRPVNGDNAHLDRGGKRAAAAGTAAVFVAPDGGVSGFPYTSAPGGTRWWSALSDFVQGGEREGMTGVVFRPARTAGDNYRVRAYLDLDRALDTADATPTGAARTVDVGEFEVWRRITLRAHWRKTAAITAALPSVTDYYADAYMDVDDQMGAPQSFNRATYDAAFTAARGAVDPAMIPALMRRYSLLPGNQYDLARPPDSFGGAVVRWFADAGRWIANLFGANLSPSPTTWVCTFRPYADFKEAARSGEGFTDAQLTAALANITADTEGRYAERCTDYASEIATEMCKAKATASGVTILQFDWTHSLEEPANDGRLNGNAVFKTRDTCGFALYNPRQDTTGHEIGHDLFLPHAPRLHSNGSVINAGGGITPDAHDVNEMRCLMSYARPRPGFCGLCVVRLAGWDRTVFDRNGPLVAK